MLKDTLYETVEPVVGVRNLESFTEVVLFNIDVSVLSINLETSEALYWELNYNKLSLLKFVNDVVTEDWISAAANVVEFESNLTVDANLM